MHGRAQPQQRRVDRIADTGREHPQVAYVERQACQHFGSAVRDQRQSAGERDGDAEPLPFRHRVAKQDQARNDDENRDSRLQHHDVERRRRLRRQIEPGVEDRRCRAPTARAGCASWPASPWHPGARAAMRKAARPAQPASTAKTQARSGGISPATLRATTALPAQNSPGSSIRSRGSSANRRSQLAEAASLASELRIDDMLGDWPAAGETRSGRPAWDGLSLPHT